MASLTYRELRSSNGCRYLRDAPGGDHEIWLCPGRKPISVPKTLNLKWQVENLKDAVQFLPDRV
jgi:hypothetical protein